MNLWKEAESLCEKVGYNYGEQLSYFMHADNAYIFKGDKWLIWAEHNEDTWFIFLAIGKGCIPTFIKCMPFWLPNFAFARFLRGKHDIHTLSLGRLCRHYGISIEHLQSAKG